jgi:transcriptional regulator with XRE-family HTH domain
MTSHHGMPITPSELRAVVKLAGITQADAAARCHAAPRTMREWLAGSRRMPLAASELLMLSLVWPAADRQMAADAKIVRRWVRPEFAALLISISDQAANSNPPITRSRP